MKINILVEVQHDEYMDNAQLFVETRLNIPKTIDDEKEIFNFKTVFFRTNFSQHTIVQKIINYWYVFVGIIIGVIIISIAFALLFKYDMFNKVRVYREEIEIINSARNSRLRNSEVAEEVNRNVFINRGISVQEEKHSGINLEMKEIKK